MKKIKIFLLLLLLIIPGSVQAETTRQALLQQIEILKYEISLLQSLLLNSQKTNINAPSYLAVNIIDDSVLLTKNSNQKYPIASITKLMNAVVALENIDKNRTVNLTEKMLKPLGASPCLFSSLNIKAENLLKASLIQSVNDASESLAYFLGQENFLNLMNKKAKELGMENTVFYDVHGLNPKNTSTASDLVKLLKYIYNNHPEILSITKENNFWLPDSSGTLLKFQNVNNFYPLSNFLGGKSGYLIEAKQTMASVFNVNGNPIAIVVLYSTNRQADILTILKKLK